MAPPGSESFILMYTHHASLLKKIALMGESEIRLVICDATGAGRLFGSLQDKGVTPVNDWRTTQAPNTPSARVRVRREPSFP